MRTTPDGGHGSTKFISAKSGLLLGEDRLALVPGVGMVGLRVRYRDYRRIRGVRIPFRTTLNFASELIGRIVIQYDEIETGLDLPASTFSLDANEAGPAS